MDFSQYKQSPLQKPTTGTLAPKAAPSFNEYKEKNLFEDTVVEGVTSLGSELAGGLGKIGTGVFDVGAGLVGGFGNIFQGKAPTTSQVERVMGGGTRALAGGMQFAFSPATAGIKALPGGIQRPVEYGMEQVGKAINTGLDFIPQGVGIATSEIGQAIGNEGMKRAGIRISQSAKSPEWATVKERAMLLPGIGAMTKTLPLVPKNIQGMVNKPGEMLTKGTGKLIGGTANVAKTGAKELFYKMVLDKPLVQNLKAQARKNPNITKALQGKLKVEDVVNRALDKVDNISSTADVVRQKTLSYLKNVEKNKIAQGKSPLIVPRFDSVRSTLDNFGLTLTKKGLAPKSGDVSKTPLTASQVKQFNEVLSGMTKKTMTPTEFWNVRSKIGDIVNVLERKGEVSPKLKSFADQLYNSWNIAGRNQIKGLQRRDAILSKAIEKTSPIRKLFYDKDGNVLPNEQIIQSLLATTNKGRTRFEELRSLEKVVPGISKELKAIQLANQVQQKAGPAVGQYGRGIMQGGAATAGVMGSLPTALGLGALSAITSPQNVAKAIVRGTRAQQKIGKAIAPTAKKVSQYIQQKQPLDIAKDVGTLAKKAIEKERQKIKDQPLRPGFISTDVLTGGKGKKAVDTDLMKEAKKYKSAEEFVKAQGTPATVSVWNKSKFSDNGAYVDIPIIRKEENITLYQGGKDGDGRQFWTPNKKYAEQFGNVKEKTGSFYKIDNGNRVADVYVEAPTKSQLKDIWKKANNKAGNSTLIEEAKKYKSADEFVKSVPTGDENTINVLGTKTGKPVVLKSYHGTNAEFDKFIIPKEGVRYSGDGVYFTPSKEGAGTFGKNVKEVYLDLKNPYVKYLPSGNIDQQFFELAKEVKAKGHDAIIVRIKDVDTKSGKLEADWINEIVVFDTNAIKTKQQLQEIYNQAHKGAKIDPLMVEAKKYKSADEFVKAHGTPVYHGTASDFEMFDPKFKGYSTGAESAKGAFWFTDDPATAKAYAIYAAEDAPVQRLLKQADEAEKIAQKTGKESDWAKYDKLVEESEKLVEYDATFARREKNAKVKEAYVKGDFLEVDAKGKTPQELSTDDNIDSWLNSKIQQAIKENKAGLKIVNIDDAVGLYDRPSTHYAVFNADQIKTKSQLEDIWKKAHSKS